jgi:hypothetical protein
MKRTLQDMIQLTKKKIESTFFKIVKTGDKNNPFIIKEYFGPLKSVRTMMNEGWNRHSYLVDYIDEEYPVFKLSDFKTTNGFRIEKKTEIDLLTAELNKYTKYFKTNPKLYEALKKLNDFLQQFGITNYMKYQTFSDVKNDFLVILSKNVQFQSDKLRFNSIFIEFLNDVYLNLELVNVASARLFFENKFMFLLSLIK